MTSFQTPSKGRLFFADGSFIGPAKGTNMSVTRRTLLGSLVGLAGSAVLAEPLTGAAAETARPVLGNATPEALVKSLHDSLTPKQREVVCFPWEHPLRTRVNNNWQITAPTIRAFFNPDQQAMIAAIFRGLHSDEYVDKVLKHLNDDQPGGLSGYHIALFGEPKTGPLAWVLTGRHCTIRCDGGATPAAAFGGPIFYGHAAGDFHEKANHPGNVYWYQAKRANAVYQALDGKQRVQALVSGPIPRERADQTVALRARPVDIEGLPVSALSRDQRGLIDQVTRDLLLPFRPADVEKAMRTFGADGGLESSKIAFYQSDDIGGDGVWDVWKIESPRLIWYFRGAPHVHAWVNLRPATS